MEIILFVKMTLGMGYLFGHMKNPTTLNVGDRVKKGDYVGHEGATGNVTGIHCHFQMLDLSNRSSWEYNLDLSEYENPATFMAIPNEYGITAIYDGTIPPKPIEIFKKKSGFKWAIYANKIRKNY